MFKVERLVKCRTTSGSDSSGNAGGVAATDPPGNSSSSGRMGTSHLGNTAARRPGRESSNNGWIAWVLRMSELGLPVGYELVMPPACRMEIHVGHLEQAGRKIPCPFFPPPGREGGRAEEKRRLEGRSPFLDG